MERYSNSNYSIATNWKFSSSYRDNKGVVKLIAELQNLRYKKLERNEETYESFSTDCRLYIRFPTRSKEARGPPSTLCILPFLRLYRSSGRSRQWLVMGQLLRASKVSRCYGIIYKKGSNVTSRCNLVPGIDVPSRAARRRVYNT